jgi:UDP-N-acetylglucosamine 2-epimerase
MSDIFFRELGIPEEINWKLTDAISDLFFVTEERPRRYCREERKGHRPAALGRPRC